MLNAIRRRWSAHVRHRPKVNNEDMYGRDRKRSTRKSILLPRPRRRKREYISPRATGESLRDWIGRNLEDSLAGYIFDSVMASLSTLLILCYVAANWMQLAKNDRPEWVRHLEMYANIVFSIEFLFRVYAAIDRIDYIRSFFPMMEFVVLLPTWFDMIVYYLDEDPTDYNFYHIALVLRALQILRSHRFLEFTTSSLQRQILAAFLIVISIIIGTSGVLQVVESCDAPCADDLEPRDCGCQDLSFLDFLYFVVVSISTLGYGDISPVSKNGKALISFIILLTFILVPIQVNRISAIVSSHTDYSSSYKEAKQHRHVVVTGHIDVDLLSMFFHEFFHSNNLNWNEKIVILHPRPPTVELKKLLNTFENKVQYLVGSPMLDEDLRRAMLQQARACYVFVNRDAPQPQHADQCSALITIALRRSNEKCPIYAQVIKMENAPTILKMGASDVVVTGALKFAILGRSCEVYGLPTLLLNLLVHPHSDIEKWRPTVPWQVSYVHGYMHGIFLVDIPRTFSGLLFGDLIRFLYERHVIPIAMLTEEGGIEFPEMDFKLGATADPNLCCKVYAIAKGLTAVENLSQISPESILSYRKNLRRKAKSALTMNDHDGTNLEDGTAGDPHARSQKAPMKPALGNHIETSIREALIQRYSRLHEEHRDPPQMPLAQDEKQAPDATRPDQDVSVAPPAFMDYDAFTTAGAPSTITQHIVVCGFPTDTYEFMQTIRQVITTNGSTTSPAVVFLAPAVIDEDEYDHIKHFRDVYYVCGSPVNFADLKKTRIDFAMSVLILTMTTELMYSDENMIDADAITTLRYIVEISQHRRTGMTHHHHHPPAHHVKMPNLVVELDKATNVKLLSSLSAQETRLTSIFATTASRMPAAAVRQTAASMAATNGRRTSRIYSTQSPAPRAESIFNPVISLTQNTDERSLSAMDSALAFEDFIVSGRVYLNSILDALMSECYRKRWICPFVHLLLHGAPAENQKHQSDNTPHPQSKRLFQVAIPEDLITIQYGTCFRRLLNDAHCICIGIWRPERGVALPHPCVLVNPPSVMYTEPGDLLYLIGKPMTTAELSELLVVKRYVDV